MGLKAALTPLGALLRRHSRVALDTNIFIYLMEANPHYVGQATEVFEWLESANHTAVTFTVTSTFTSTVTLTEILVRPYRESNEQWINRYFALLTLFPNLEWVAPSLPIADRVAQLRAQYEFRTPDALQLATALNSSATAILSNDTTWQRVQNIEVAVLDQFR